MRASIPEEFRASATCEIDSESDYDCGHYVTVTIEYERPATPEEIAAVESLHQNTLIAREAEERAVYEALKAKFG